MLSKILYGKKGSSFDDAAFSFVRKALCLKKGETNCDCYCCQLALSAMPDYRIYDNRNLERGSFYAIYGNDQ